MRAHLVSVTVERRTVHMLQYSLKGHSSTLHSYMFEVRHHLRRVILYIRLSSYFLSSSLSSSFIHYTLLLLVPSQCQRCRADALALVIALRL